MTIHKTLASILGLIGLAVISLQAQAVAITDLSVKPLSAGRTELEITFDGPAPAPVGYSVEQPARIALDFANTESRLAQKQFQISSGNLRNVVVVSSGNRTRLVLSMARLMPYATSVSGRRVRIIVGEGVEQSRLWQPQKPDGAGLKTAALSALPAADIKVIDAQALPSVQTLSLQPLGDGAARLQLKLSQASAGVDLVERDGRVRLRIADHRLAPALAGPFSIPPAITALSEINLYQDAEDAVVELAVDNAFELQAYQADGLVTVEWQLPQPPLAVSSDPAVKEPAEELISLNLQDIEVRFALQQIADFVGLNLVVSDAVQGNLSVRLNNIPWPQALELVLRSKGLDKRQLGDVLLVAPAAELAEQERLALENQQQINQLLPLKTDFIQVNYAKADDLLTILQDSHDGSENTANAKRLGFLSERGAVSIDARTNTLIVRDTQHNLDIIRQAIERFDVPVRQVLIEARIVAARTSVGEQLGVRWGGNVNSGGTNPTVVSGSLESTASIGNDLNASGGNSYDQSYPDALVVDLPVLNPSATSFAIGVAAFDYALDLELSALETRGSAEVVSQPRVVTSNGQEAFINSGQSIAFDGAEGGTTFVDAGLSLRVTPQITPDDHVLLDLIVTQDSLASAGGAIDTNSVATEVLVDDGETLVLGGVYRTETVKTTEQTPLLGKLPLLGRLFRRSAESEEKTELLIFITPRLIGESLAAN